MPEPSSNDVACPPCRWYSPHHAGTSRTRGPTVDGRSPATPTGPGGLTPRRPGFGRGDGPAQPTGQIAPGAHRQPVETQPRPEPVELGRRQLEHRGRRGRRLEVGAQHLQGAGGAIGLEIESGHQLVPDQEREHVVPVGAQVPGHVDADAVVEVEQPLGAFPGPDERVERRQEGGLLPPEGPEPNAGQHVTRLGPPLHGHRLQPALLHQFLHPGPARTRPEPEVVGQIGGGGHAQAPGGPDHQLALGLLVRWRW